MWTVRPEIGDKEEKGPAATWISRFGDKLGGD
jgi:hypothetical protein